MDRNNNTKSLWLRLSLVNLCIVAFFGFTLRTKILFYIPFIDYRNLLSAHSHFAFAGWVGLAIITLLIFNTLPEKLHNKQAYRWILIGTQCSAIGMAALFPVIGYTSASICFSSLYIFMNYIFGWVYIKDVLKTPLHPTLKFLCISTVGALLLSALGPLGLVYILISKSGDSILYRDSIYTFLHMQYNGFFTLGVFSLFFKYITDKGLAIGKAWKNFSLFLVLAVIPSLFLSLLWHNSTFFYVLAAIGCLFILIALFYFTTAARSLDMKVLFTSSLARNFILISFISFFIKMLLNAGTIIPQLGNAVYGDRPAIIGFLHLVFLAFVSLYILSYMINAGMFLKNGKNIRLPFYVFMAGIVANEAVLMIQGLSILFKSNSNTYNWLLWIAAFMLVVGAIMIALVSGKQKSQELSPGRDY